jgi:hypothetical protein
VDTTQETTQPQPPGSERPAAVTWLARAALASWAIVISLAIGSLMVGHWVALPRPAVGDSGLADALAEVLPAKRTWTMVHVLYADCPCSRQVFDHLAARERPKDTHECILLVGEDVVFEGLACRAGFQVVSLTDEDLERRFGIQAAPLLLVTAPDGRVAYSGGYTDRKRGMAFQDEHILFRVRAGESVDGLPVYGCGVAKSLQDTLDPFGLKYE